MTVLNLVPKKRSPLYCSFCGKEKDEVAYLVAGPTVFICNECVELCRQVGTEMLVENALPGLPTVSEAEGRAMADSEASPSDVTFGYSIPEMDVEAFFNMRGWLQASVEAKGAKMVGGGIGMGQADIDVELEGCRYNISIRPLQPTPQGTSEVGHD